MSVLIEEVLSLPPNSLFSEMMNELIELKNHILEKLFYSLNLNHIQIELQRITQLPRPFIDLIYSLPNIRPQIIKLCSSRKKLSIPPMFIYKNFPKINDIDFNRNVRLISGLDDFLDIIKNVIPGPFEKNHCLRGTGDEMKNKWPKRNDIDFLSTINSDESDSGYKIKPIPWLEYSIPDRYNPYKKTKKSNQNFVDDKLIWLWESNMYTDPEMNIIY